jgi:outer membrane protein OmpA-like peptidoglycan-associated protein
MKRLPIVALRWIPAAVAAGIAAGCTQWTALPEVRPATVSHCTAPQGIELIIGAHRDESAPRLSRPLVCQLTAAIQAGRPVHVVVAAGRPQLLRVRLISVRGGTLAQQGSPRVQQDVRKVLSAVAAARPGSPGIDDLAALSVAADDARSEGCPHAELVLIDSGLDDRGPLDFTVPGMLAATPGEVVGQLKASGNLPGLGGFTAVLAGIGYTAAPQPPLSTKWRSSVTRIWAAVLMAAGARVDVIPQPGRGPSVRTDEPVRPVAVPATQPVMPHRHATITFTGESPVRFEPDTTAFVDRVAAVSALRPIARWLGADPARRAFLEGTTADVGPMSGQVALASARADRIKAVLVALGASPAQLTTRGVGSDFQQFVPDRDSAGVLLAGPAALNRSVRITLYQPS